MDIEQPNGDWSGASHKVNRRAPIQAPGGRRPRPAAGAGNGRHLDFRLSGVRGVVVRPISAVRKYADLEQDPLAAGKEQQVDAVLDSTIQTVDGKVRDDRAARQGCRRGRAVGGQE